MTTPAATPRSPVSLVLPVALAAAALFWAFWSTFAELAYTWNYNPQYSHGFLVPGFAAFLLWLRRDKLDLDACKPSVWGLVLIAAGVGLRLFATYKYYVSLEPIAILPCAAGLVLLFGGWAAWKWAWPAVMFLAFMIPLPFSVASAMSGPLQRLATITSTFVMQTLGMPALSEGNVILLNEHKIGIVEACSGLRMLVVFFALSTAVVLVIPRHWVDRTLIILSAVPIAILSNIIRVTATGIMFEMGHSEFAQHFFHDIAGWLMMPLALGMLWIELTVLKYLFVDAPAKAATPTAASATRRAPASSRSPVPRSTRRPATKPTTTPAPVEQAAQKS